MDSRRCAWSAMMPGMTGDYDDPWAVADPNRDMSNDPVRRKAAGMIIPCGLPPTHPPHLYESDNPDHPGTQACLGYLAEPDPS